MAREKDDKPFWIKFEMDKWEGGVDGLTPEAEYLFFRICRKIWSTGKPVFLEQISSIGRSILYHDVLLEELVRSGKVTVSNGLIRNEKAKQAHFVARKTMNENKKRTKKATETRKKKALTPGKEKENPSDRDDARYVDIVEKSKIEKNSLLSFPLKSTYKNSNSQKSNEGKNDNVNKVGTLKADTYEAAKRIAPGYDIYNIEERWRTSGFANKAKRPDAAFLGFLKKHIQENPL